MLKRLHLFSNGLMPFDHDRDILHRIHKHYRWWGECWESCCCRKGHAEEAGWTVSDSNHGSQVQAIHALSSLRKIPTVNEKKILLDSLKFFNPLILLAQRDMTVENALQYELTPIPLSLFSNKDLKMNKANKVAFSKSSLKGLTDTVDRTDQACQSLVVDGGWLLYMVKWEAGQTWQEIADSYLRYVKCLGKESRRITVVFDGYNSSQKDHDHIRRTKNSCCDMQIRPDMIASTTRAKFLDNTHNKSELIQLFSLTFQRCQITVELGDNDADTSIVGAALAAAIDGSVDCFMYNLLFSGTSRRYWCAHTPLYLFFTASKGSYDIRSIREALSEKQRRYLLLCHAFTGCDTVSAISGHGKTSLFDKFVQGRLTDVFLDLWSEVVLQFSSTYTMHQVPL